MTTIGCGDHFYANFMAALEEFLVTTVFTVIIAPTRIKPHTRIKAQSKIICRNYLWPILELRPITDWILERLRSILIKVWDKPLENLEKGNNPTKADETENEKNELFILDSADYWFLVSFHILHLLRVNSSSVERCFPFLWEGGFHRFWIFGRTERRTVTKTAEP